MKKFDIKNAGPGKWLVSHNEVPKFTCQFENRRFNYERTITGVSNPAGHPKEVQLMQRMEKWLKEYHKEKIES